MEWWKHFSRVSIACPTSRPGLGEGGKAFCLEKRSRSARKECDFFLQLSVESFDFNANIPNIKVFFGHNEGCKRFAWTKVESLGARKKYDFFLEIYPKKVFISALKCLICIKVFLERNTGDC